MINRWWSVNWVSRIGQSIKMVVH